MNYLELENKLIKLRNRLPLVSPKMDKQEIHHLAHIIQGIDLSILHLIKIRKLDA